MAKAERVSIREFARRLGCSDTAVRRAIREKKIKHGVKKNAKGRPVIVVEVARREWREAHDFSGHQNRTLFEKLHQVEPLTAHALEQPKSSLIPKDKPVESAEDAAPDPEPVPPPPTREPTEGELALQKANQDKAFFQAEKLRVEHEQRIGLLVEKSKVYSVFNAIGREFRQAMLAIPDRHIDAIYHAEDRAVAHVLLREAIAEVLDKLSQPREISVE